MACCVSVWCLCSVKKGPLAGVGGSGMGEVGDVGGCGGRYLRLRRLAVDQRTRGWIENGKGTPLMERWERGEASVHVMRHAK